MRALLVLAGTPPTHELLKTEFEIADLIVGVDGGADVFQDMAISPNIIIGDFDSNKSPADPACLSLHLPDENQSDLQKALHYITKEYPITQITLLGASGGRTDHLIHNLQICALVDPEIFVRLKQFIYLDGEFIQETIHRLTPNIKIDLQVKVGTTLSVFSVNAFSGLNSKGLKWELNNINSTAGVISQSNIAVCSDPQFSLNAGTAYLSIYQ